MTDIRHAYLILMLLISLIHGFNVPNRRIKSFHALPLRFAEQGDSTELSQAIDSPQEIKNEAINVSLNLGQLKPFLDIAVPFFQRG